MPVAAGMRKTRRQMFPDKTNRQSAHQQAPVLLPDNQHQNAGSDGSSDEPAACQPSQPWHLFPAGSAPGAFRTPHACRQPSSAGTAGHEYWALLRRSPHPLLHPKQAPLQTARCAYQGNPVCACANRSWLRSQMARSARPGVASAPSPCSLPTEGA